MNLAGLFTGIGQAGSDVAAGALNAHELKLKDLYDKLGLQQGEVNLQESQERLKKMQGNQELEKQMQLKAAFKSVFGRDPTEEESKQLFGFAPPTPQKPAPVSKTPFELWREKNPNGTYDDWVADSKKEKEVAPLKPTKTVTYDPSGHLRTAWIEPSTGKVSAWGPLAEAKSGMYHYKDEETGNIYEVATFKPNIKPGEVRMTDEAQKVWDNELHGKDTYATAPVKKSKDAAAKTPAAGATSTPAASLNKGSIVGHTLPKDEVNLKKSLTETKEAYANYIGAQQNLLNGGAKGQLAVVFAAVRAQVAGAGRMTNAEIQNEIKFGSYGEKFQRAFTLGWDGKLTKEDQDELLNVIRNGWASKAVAAKEDWKRIYGEKEMPSYLNVDMPKSGGGEGAPPPGAKIRDYSTIGPG